MATPLRVLIVEDSEDDTELLVRELRRGGFEPDYRQVANEDDLQAALEQRWDVVLCDYTMPGFSGTRALMIMREHGKDIPFIFVSGTIGEDVAVAAMRAGARDYLIKSDLKRLTPAIAREMRETEIRWAHERAEADRRVAESRFREVLAVAPDAIVAADRRQNIKIFNRSAETLFGYLADEVLDKPLDILLPLDMAEYHRQRLAEFEQTSETVRRMSEHPEITGRRKNGEIFPAEASISKLVENGRTTFLAVIRDITDRKRDEAALRKLSRAVESSINLIVITDRDGIIEYANPSFLTTMGYPEDEVIGQTPRLVKSSNMDGAVYADLWQTILSGSDWRGELENQSKEGQTLTVKASISPIKNETGEITHFVSIQEDISRHKELEEQLRQAQKMEAVGQMTGGMAHDFNNLLAVIIGNIELLQDRIEDRPEASDLAQKVLDATIRGAKLTSQMLAFSRRQTLAPSVLDLNHLVSGMTELLRRTLGEQIEIKLDLADSLWPVFADATQVESALINLAINARDAMADGGRLVIETDNRQLDETYTSDRMDVVPGDYTLLAVSDSGVGIPSDVLDRVFEPFMTTKDVGKGSGLGLSMVYGFAKQSGGHISIYSEEGVGTTVCLYLPKADKSPAEKPVDGIGGRQVDLTGLRVLVVEDNENVRAMAVKQLTLLGCETREAGLAADALEILAGRDRFDLLFTDLVLPGGMSGLQLVDEARKLRPDLKCLLTSGFAEVAIDHGLDRAAGQHFLNKPYRRADLAKKIIDVLHDR